VHDFGVLVKSGASGDVVRMLPRVLAVFLSCGSIAYTRAVLLQMQLLQHLGSTRHPAMAAFLSCGGLFSDEAGEVSLSVLSRSCAALPHLTLAALQLHYALVKPAAEVCAAVELGVLQQSHARAAHTVVEPDSDEVRLLAEHLASVVVDVQAGLWLIYPDLPSKNTGYGPQASVRPLLAVLQPSRGLVWRPQDAARQAATHLGRMRSTYGPQQRSQRAAAVRQGQNAGPAGPAEAVEPVEPVEAAEPAEPAEPAGPAAAEKEEKQPAARRSGRQRQQPSRLRDFAVGAAAEAAVDGRAADDRAAADCADSEQAFWPAERVLAQREVGGRLQFYVKWLGYAHADDSWVDEDAVSEPLLDDWLRRRSQA
jgi:hypothetical protein